MSKTLVIVESPGKIAKIGQFLGPAYIVKASFGHVMDLDKETLSIDDVKWEFECSLRDCICELNLIHTLVTNGALNIENDYVQSLIGINEDFYKDNKK